MIIHQFTQIIFSIQKKNKQCFLSAYRFWESFLKVNPPILSLRIRRKNHSEALKGGKLGDRIIRDKVMPGVAPTTTMMRTTTHSQTLNVWSIYLYMNDWFYGK